jgi:putative ABC transport system permease protein
VEKAIASLDPDLAVFDVKPMDRRVDAALAQPRFRTTLLALFAATAVLLAAIGTYGVMAYAVAERRRETGVRVALGARPAQVLALVLRDGMKLAAAGIGAGTALALALARGLESLLFGVAAVDPLTFGLVPAILALVALSAAYLPARRATRADPVAALRSE